MVLSLHGRRGILRFAAAGHKHADNRLAGVSLLVRGRHGLYVSALAALLSSRGARVWESAEAERTAPRLPRGVEVVVLESPLPSELREMAATGVPVIVLADRAEPADALSAAQLGASALLTKNCSLAELVVAIRGISGGAPAAPVARLTARQRQVLGLIVEGLDNSQIATRLGVSERTVRAHVSAVLERLGRRQPHPGRRGRDPAWLAGAADDVDGCWCSSCPGRYGGRHAGRAARRAGPSDAGAGGSAGAWVNDGSGATVFKWKAGIRRVPASVQKLVTTAAALDRLGPGAPDSRRPCSPTARSPRACFKATSICAARGTRAWAPPHCGALRKGSVRPVSSRWTAASTGTRASSTAAAGGSGFGISPYVGPLSALAFNRGSMLPLARGWQSDPPALHRRTHAGPAAQRAGRRRPARPPGPHAGRCDDAGRDRIAAARGPRAAHEPRVRQLLRGDAAEGPGRPLGHDRLDGGRSGCGLALRAGARLRRPGRRRLRALARQLHLTARRRPPAGGGAGRAMVRRLLPLPAAGR